MTPAFFWNEGAISYMVEALLAVILAAFLWQLVVRELLQKRAYIPTFLLALMNATLILSLLATLARSLVAGGWLSYVMPWADPTSPVTLFMPWAVPFGGATVAILATLSYVFPRPLPGTGAERRAFAVLMAVIFLAECACAIQADLAIIERRIWWRPGWMGLWMTLVMVWAIVVQWRQLAMARVQTGECSSAQTPGARPSRMARIFVALALPLRRPINRESAVARGMMVISMLPAFHTLALFVSEDGVIGGYPVDLFMCWSALIMLTGFTLIFLGYLPERSSFLFKLTIIGTALAFAAISGSAWIMGVSFEQQYRADDLPPAHSALHFEPTGATAYAVTTIDYAPLATGGVKVGPDGSAISLPFAVSFYGRRYNKVFVDSRGSIGFERMPQARDAAFAGGAQPEIIPLLVDADPTGTTIAVTTGPRSLAVTRTDRCANESSDSCYRYQTVVHADGGVDFHYASLSTMPRYHVFDPLSAPWMTGLLPGWRAAGTGIAVPAVHDYHRSFLARLDRLLAPLVGFTLWVAVAVLIGLRVLFRGFLVQPLDRLLAGMRRFREGGPHKPVPVSFNDEIGYLTESFNEMARVQRHLVDTLEQRVAERTEEAASYAARSAQLEERTRIASDLHDTVSQTLFLAAMQADQYARAMHADASANEGFRRLAGLNRMALDEMRLLLVAARHGTASGSSVADRLEGLLADFDETSDFAIAADISGEGTVPADVAHAFCQIAREALNNAAKHSGANSVTVAADIASAKATLSIVDDGIGFDPRATRPQSLGIQIMRDRARQVNAMFSVASTPAAGTKIELAWGSRELD